MPRNATAAALVDPGALLASTHELDDGTRVRMRLARPSDAPQVADFLERLTPETREGRFLEPMPEVTDAAVRHFTFTDPRQRMTIAATMPLDGTELIVGLADAAFLAPGQAEIGLVVDDERQRLGLGKLLSEAVAALAIQRGAKHLKAAVKRENAPMQRLFERLGRTVHSVEDGTATLYVRLDTARGRSAA